MCLGHHPRRQGGTRRRRSLIPASIRTTSWPCDRLELQLRQDFAVSEEYSGIRLARSAGDEVIQVWRQLRPAVRFDLLNAFNTRNYAQLFDGYPGKPFYFTDGNLYGVPRTVKVGHELQVLGETTFVNGEALSRYCLGMAALGAVAMTAQTSEPWKEQEPGLGRARGSDRACHDAGREDPPATRAARICL